MLWFNFQQILQNTNQKITTATTIVIKIMSDINQIALTYIHTYAKRDVYQYVHTHVFINIFTRGLQ